MSDTELSGGSRIKWNLLGARPSNRETGDFRG